MNESKKHEALKPSQIVYEKDKVLENAEEKISDILSEAIYRYIIRNKLKNVDD